jgi:pimeloyl-ACP methyl ester carboxylesterase
MHTIVLAAVVAAGALFAPPGAASAENFAPGFTHHVVRAGGRTFYYRDGGRGSVVVLLHGYGDTGDMWAPLAQQLASHYRVIVPDLPGLGRSRPAAWNAPYDMASVARSFHALFAQLGIHHEAVVSHDIGLMVAYAYAAQFPADVSKLVLIDAPIPGVGPWQQVLLMPATWHFHFNGKYAEQLVAGRERIYLNRIWDDFAAHPERISEATRTRYAASYAQPGNMHAGFQYFAAFYTDAAQNVAFAKTPLPMPVLAMGGAKSFGSLEPAFANAVATDVHTSVIPDSGHWIMDENPKATEAAVIRFLAEPTAAATSAR